MNVPGKRLLIGAAACVMAVVPLATQPGSVEAMATDAATAAHPATTRSHELSALVMRLQRAGKQDAALERALERRGYDVMRPAAVPAGIAARSDAGDVSVKRPMLVHDTGSKWLWMATYTWNNANFSGDQPGSCAGYDRCQLLGKDAFGLAFSKVLNMTDYWATFGPREAGTGDRILNPWEANRWGVVYRKQDIVERRTSPDDLNMYFGNIVVAINGRPCGQTNAYAKYAHTWSNRDLAGVTINASVISYTFDGSSGRFQETSQPGTDTRNC